MAGKMGPSPLGVIVLVTYLLTILLGVDSKISYKGYNYLIVEPNLEEHLTIIDRLRHVERETVVVLTDPSPIGYPVSMVINRSYIPELIQEFKLSQLPYRIVSEDVGSIYEAQKTRRGKRSAQDDFNYYEYHPLDEIQSHIEEVVSNNTDIAELIKIGNSYEGRDFYAVRLSTGDGRNAFWMDGGIHANEWIAPATMLCFLRDIISSYRDGSDTIISDVLNNLDVYILPVFNVDGYEYTWTDDRLWRKTRSPNLESDCYGTDPNRNWDTQYWGELGVSDDPCTNQYPGPGPFSEPEVRAVADFVSRNNVTLYMAYHSCSQYYMIPYGISEDLPPDYDELIEIADAAAQIASDTNGADYEAGTLQQFFALNSGSSADYTYDNLGITYSFGIELRDGPGPDVCTLELPEDQIEPTCTENFAALRDIFERVYNAVI